MNRSRWPRRDWLFAGLLVLAVLLVYQQAWNAGYIWDDDFHVTRNPTLRDLHGLWRIWFEPSATPQYYPLVHTSFWLEYHLWGLRSLGYHLVNISLHGIAAVLLWRVLLFLRVPGAWLAAAVFALHPVEVESVAWITERKNVLSAVFYFASALAYLRYSAARDASTPGKSRILLYAASLFLFLCALWSKTVACSLPVALLLVRWWKTGRLQWRDVFPLLPFFGTGAAFGLFTAWMELHHVGALGADFSLSLPQRFLVAGRALWFYAGKILWPAGLAFAYPRWEIDARLAWQWLFPLAAIALIALLWRFRGRIGRGPLVAALFFVSTLFPALGFLNVYPFRFSYVADHFQYLASLGLTVPAAVLLNRLPRAFPVAVLALLAFLTWKQAGIYRDSEALWTDALQKDPDSWMAQTAYGVILSQEGKQEEALVHFRRAQELNPDNATIENDIGRAYFQSGRALEALPYLRRAIALDPRPAAFHYNLGSALRALGRRQEALTEFDRALELDPTFVPVHVDAGGMLLEMGRLEESLAHLKIAVAAEPQNVAAQANMANTLLQMGRADEAVSHLAAVLAIHPHDPDALKNLAWVLATSPEERLRNGGKAVEFAERARAADTSNPFIAATLAAAYAESGRFPDASREAERALRLAKESGNTALAELARNEIALFEAGQPFRDIR
ncbi:MAG: tetratricopeptide repeat protein [Chthoniobacterales bacterium]